MYDPWFLLLQIYTCSLCAELTGLGVVNGPLKNEKTRQILPKSRNLAQPTNGPNVSQSLRFCAWRSHICFSVKSLSFSGSVSDFKMPVSAPRRVSDLPFATPRTIWQSVVCLGNALVGSTCSKYNQRSILWYEWTQTGKDWPKISALNGFTSIQFCKVCHTIISCCKCQTEK